MGLISESLNNKLNELIGECFELNRLCDRGQSLFTIKWKMPNFGWVVHHCAAHLYIGDDFADSIGEYQEARDNLTVYPATFIGNMDYNSPMGFIVAYHNKNLEFERMVKDAVDAAIEEGDTTTKVFLDGLLSRLTPMITQSQLFVDMATQYGDDAFHLQMLDSVIKNYVDVSKAI